MPDDVAPAQFIPQSPLLWAVLYTPPSGDTGSGEGIADLALIVGWRLRDDGQLAPLLLLDGSTSTITPTQGDHYAHVFATRQEAHASRLGEWP